MDTTDIRIKFTIERDGYSYADALYFSPQEYNSLTPEQIEAMKEERFQNWLTAINTPPVEQEQTSEDLQRSVEQIDEQIAQLTQQKEELQVKVEQVLVEEKAVSAVGVVKGGA